MPLRCCIGGGDGAIANARPGSLLDAFFFSVQTMASIGYGALYPQSLYANIVIVLEFFVGLLFIAMATGISFARFSVPTARILFSRYAVVAPVNQVPMLMFRTANRRRNRILEARLWVTLVRDEATQAGEELRRFMILRWCDRKHPLFALTWTAMHPIDAQSPLYGATSDSLKAAHAEVIVIIAGMDETTSQTIHSRHSFVADEILWNYRFEDILGWITDGYRAINDTQFDQVRAASSSET